MNPKIIIIDDDYKPEQPIIVKLKENFGDDNVLLFNQSKDGLQYILKNLSGRIILILDWNLDNQTKGIDIFKKIQEKTSLIYTIFVSAVQVSNIPNEDLIELINNHAFSFIQKGSSYLKIFEKVIEVSHLLQTRLDCAIEEWISLHSPKEKDKPYLTTRSGKVYTLNDLLYQIRTQTEFGMTMERNILQLTIDLLSRNKEQVDD